MLTRLLIAINIIAYGWEYTSGALTSDSTLESHGALVGTLVLDGEWWRIFTAGFIHYGILHILLNSYALFQVGILVEYIYGSARFLVIYLVALVAGGVTAYYWTIGSDVATAGASGAIMGVFGAMGVLGFKIPHARGPLLQSALFPIVLTLGNGLVNAGVSTADHIGGLIGGVLVAAVMTPARGAALRGDRDA